MKMRFRLAALALGLLAAVAGAELALRVMNMGFGSSPMEPDPFLHHIHPKNYTFVQQHPSGELGGFEIQYNAEGRVFDGKGAAPGPASACRVALMGDSFTEGGQVPFAVSFAGVLERAALGTCEVRNYGVRSYSPAIYLVQWQREVRNWHPTHVFLLLFDNDVREDVSYLSTAVIGDDGWPLAIQGPSSGWLFSQLRRSYVARFVRMVTQRAEWALTHDGDQELTVGGVVEENPPWSGPSPGLVRELDRRVRADGTRLVVMAVPSRYRLMGDGKLKIDRDFHEKVKTWSAEHDVEFLDLSIAFERASRSGPELFFRQDIHFTAAGHAVTAATIARAFPDLFPKAPAASR